VLCKAVSRWEARVTAALSMSTPRKRLPSCRATSPVVPVPHMGSTTSSPGAENAYVLHLRTFPAVSTAMQNDSDAHDTARNPPPFGSMVWKRDQDEPFHRTASPLSVTAMQNDSEVQETDCKVAPGAPSFVGEDHLVPFQLTASALGFVGDEIPTAIQKDADVHETEDRSPDGPVCRGSDQDSPFHLRTYGPPAASVRSAMQKVFETHDTGLANRAGVASEPPLVVDQVEPDRVTRFPWLSLAMQNDVVGHEMESGIPGPSSTRLGSTLSGLDQLLPFHVTADDFTLALRERTAGGPTIATQKVTVGHETDVTGLWSVFCDADQDSPFHRKLSPPLSTAMQNEVVGHETSESPKVPGPESILRGLCQCAGGW
jgi:hypothetical protein